MVQLLQVGNTYYRSESDFRKLIEKQCIAFHDCSPELKTEHFHNDHPKLTNLTNLTFWK